MFQGHLICFLFSCPRTKIKHISKEVLFLFIKDIQDLYARCGHHYRYIIASKPCQGTNVKKKKNAYILTPCIYTHFSLYTHKHTYKNIQIYLCLFICASVQFSCSVVSNSLQPHELQHSRPPCQSPTPRVHPHPCPSVMPSNHLILCCSLLLLPSIFPSIRVFSYESVICMRWPKYWSFSFSISPSNEHSGLISFRMY